MKTYVALLRGINVAGQRKIKIPDLKSLFEKNGFDNVKTYLQSGNVLFTHKNAKAAQGTTIEKLLKAELGYDVSVLTIDKDTFLNIAQNNPLLNDPKVDPAFLHITFLFAPPSESIPIESIPLNGDEQAHLHNAHYYLYCPHGYGRTKIHTGYFEKTLNSPATTRNWKTVNALVQMLSE